jgi:hypothetical protein
MPTILLFTVGGGVIFIFVQMSRSIDVPNSCALDVSLFQFVKEQRARIQQAASFPSSPFVSSQSRYPLHACNVENLKFYEFQSRIHKSGKYLGVGRIHPAFGLIGARRYLKEIV